jgi:ABC-type multidrug transport system fused ATPase/permease subunit
VPEQVVATEPSFGLRVILSFWPFFRPYRKRIVTWFFIYGAYFACGILTPIAVKIYFDSVLPSRSIPRIWLFAGVYGIYALIYHGLYFVGIQGTVRIIESVVSDLRLAVYRKLHRLTISYFDKTLSGEIVNRVTNDTRQLLTLVGSELVNVSLQMLMGVVAFVILLTWNANLAVVVLCFVPVYGWLVRRFLPEVRKAARAWRRAEDRLWGNWGEKLKGMAVIQAFTRERREALTHHQFGHVSSDTWYRMTMQGTRLNVLGGLTSGVSRHSAFAMGCLLVINGDMLLGELLSLSGLIGYMLAPVETAFGLISTWQQSAVSAERIARILEEVEEAMLSEGRRRITEVRGEVRFEHVSFEYEPGKPVLQDIHYSVPAGTSVALVGHTGCGKTTTVNLLQDFYRPVKGSILIDGTPTVDIHPQDLRRHVGVVPQDVVLFSDTLRANVAYGKPAASDSEIWKVLEAAQIDGYVKALPNGLDTRVGGEEGVTPSEGEAQRLSIARALLIDPAIVILDEATSSLDSMEEALLQVAVKELLRKRTSFIVAHRLSTIRNCDFVVVMERGRVVEMGNPGNLLAKPDSVYANLHRAHFAAGVIRG